MDILGTDLKSQLSLVLGDIHDSFSREIYALIEQPEDFSSSTGNPLYRRTSTGRKEKVKTPIQARIKYFENQAEEVSELNLQNSKGVVRIKVNLADSVLIQDASSVEVDGDLYRRASDAKVIGSLSIDYHSYFLVRQD